MMIRKTAAVAALLLLGAASVQVMGQEGGPSPAQQAAARARNEAQTALEANYPKLNVDIKFLELAMPNDTMGETMGVSTNSKGHLFVYTRTENQGIARGGKAAKLFEFDQNYKFVKEWGKNGYGESFAHAVRVDRHDNVWPVDEGSGMIVKFNPQGQHVFWLGRVPEAIDYLEANLEVLKFSRVQQPLPGKPVGRMGAFDRETDIAFDSQDNMFIPDGYGNSRVVKITAKGDWVKAVGTNGSGPNQFSTPHAITSGEGDLIYVADRGNYRIQVYDNDLNFKKSITGIGAPWALCTTMSKPEVIYSGDGTGKVYKIDPQSGKVLGMFITGQDHGSQNTGNLIHSLDCRDEHTVYIGSAAMWDVQKVTIK